MSPGVGVAADPGPLTTIAQMGGKAQSNRGQNHLKSFFRRLLRYFLAGYGPATIEGFGRDSPA
jgi:hypothetical protein